MNKAIWIISPNWVVWVLLAIASISLLGLVIYFWSRPNQRHNHVSVVSWLALVSAMVSVVCVFTRSPYSTDTPNMITILGVLITLLVGWQIFALININGIDTRIREIENRLHQNMGEICSDISSTHPNDGTMAHVVLLFAIHAIIHYSESGEYERCEREISALIGEERVISAEEPDLRAMYHRMTGRIVHPERIANFGDLVRYINKLFSQPTQQP